MLVSTSKVQKEQPKETSVIDRKDLISGITILIPEVHPPPTYFAPIDSALGLGQAIRGSAEILWSQRPDIGKPCHLQSTRATSLAWQTKPSYQASATCE